MKQIGTSSGKTYYLHTYRIDEELKLPFDGMPFMCLLHRSSSEFGVTEIEDLIRHLLHRNVRSIFCAGEASRTMKKFIDQLIDGEGWLDEADHDLPVSWGSGTTAARNLDDFQLCDSSVSTLYALVLVLGDDDVAAEYEAALSGG